MSEITNEELGRRRFQIQREKAVETAYGKIRRATAQDWESLSSEDREILKEVLGDVWTRTERVRWDSYSFSSLLGSDVKTLIEIGRKIKTDRSSADISEKLLDDIFNHKI
jgi:hypothetical protein